MSHSSEDPNVKEMIHFDLVRMLFFPVVSEKQYDHVR